MCIEVGDASRVEVTGDGRGKAETLKWNEILVDTTKAGRQKPTVEKFKQICMSQAVL